MCLNIGRDFWCAYQGRWVAESEFNGEKSGYYHEPKNGTPYMAASMGPCKCLTCTETDKRSCHWHWCDQPKKLSDEQALKRIKYASAFDTHGNFVGSPSDLDLESRCARCMAQYKMNGKLR